MSLSHKYEDFGSFNSAMAPAQETLAEAFEDQKLQSFEEGYQAGWDDAIKAQADDKARVSAQLDQSLQEMSFTYHEALAKLTTSMRPIMEQVVEKLLPAIARDAVGSHIVEQITGMLRQAGAHPIEIVVSDEGHKTIEALLNRELTEPFSIVREPSLSPGQAFVRIGDSEREIDVDSVVNGVSEAVNAFFHQVSEEQKHG